MRTAVRLPRGMVHAAGLVACLIATSCAAPRHENEKPTARAVPPLQYDPGTQGPVAGVGVESQDVVQMTDQMMRDISANARIRWGKTAPRVIVDAEYFTNDSSQAINKNIITDRLRVNLNRASQGRLMFVARHYADMVERERELKRDGKTDIGTTGLTRAQAGGDYRLGGRITSLDSRQKSTGMIQRFTQISFELVDLETAEIVWSGLYDFARAAADDVIYR